MEYLKEFKGLANCACIPLSSDWLEWISYSPFRQGIPFPTYWSIVIPSYSTTWSALLNVLNESLIGKIISKDFYKPSGVFAPINMSLVGICPMVQKK